MAHPGVTLTATALAAVLIALGGAELPLGSELGGLGGVWALLKLPALEDIPLYTDTPTVTDVGFESRNHCCCDAAV